MARCLFLQHLLHGGFNQCDNLGNRDAAFEGLERAWDQRDAGLVETHRDRYLVSLHEDPRWQSFLKKMGFLD